jgi:hypothetical protein
MRGDWIDVHAPLPRSQRREAGETRKSDYGKNELAEALRPVPPTHHMTRIREVKLPLVRQMARGEIRGEFMLEGGGLSHNSLPGLITYPIIGDGPGIAGG